MKRPLFILLLGPTLGLLLQTLIAWACHTYSSPSTGGSGLVAHPTVIPGSRTITGFRYPLDWMPRHRVEHTGFGRIRESVSEQEWMGSRPGLMDGLGRQATFQGFGAGWPMISLVGMDYVSPEVAANAPPALVRGPSWLGSRIGATMYPIWPRWSGLLVNTLIFAAPVWLFMWTWGLRCAARRRRLGLCQKCGYSIRGIERCPECGTPARP